MRRPRGRAICNDRQGDYSGRKLIEDGYTNVQQIRAYKRSTAAAPTYYRRRFCVGSIAFYKGAAIILLNTLVLFLALNMVVYLYLLVRQPFAYGKELQRTAYPGWSASDLERLMRETRWHEMAYRPLVGYKSRESHGKYVNITPYGARRGKVNLSWPPSPGTLNVFVFGGSTTFGYGVTDWETIPSYIQEPLQKVCDRAVAVYTSEPKAIRVRKKLRCFWS